MPLAKFEKKDKLCTVYRLVVNKSSSVVNHVTLVTLTVTNLKKKKNTILKPKPSIDFLKKPKLSS